MRSILRRTALTTGLIAGLILLAAPALAQTGALTVPTETIRTETLIADYFAADPTHASTGAVIVLGGSEGGLGGSRNLARRLAEEGYSAIAVSYFGEVGQSAKLDHIPIEPVEHALDWLNTRSPAPSNVAVIGVSKGAELALLVASRNPTIKAVIVGVPSNVIWQGIDMGGGPTGSSWTAEGTPLPYVPYDLSRGFRGIFNLYADSLPTAPDEAIIRVENINGPILMISGAADSLWPSADMAERIEHRLSQNGFVHEVINLAYPDAGHAAFGPPVAADAPGLERALALGGTIPGLVAARADGWPRVIVFLGRTLGPPV